MRFVKTIDGRYVDASLLTSIYTAPDIDRSSQWTLRASFTCGDWVLARFSTRAAADIAARDMAMLMSGETCGDWVLAGFGTGAGADPAARDMAMVLSGETIAVSA